MKVRYTRTIIRQIDAAVTHLKAENPKAAGGLQERINTVVALLVMHPHIARETSGRNIRRFPLGIYPYLLDYSVGDGEIVLRRFRHASRRLLA